MFKEISWLWKTAYNCAVQGCTEWENAGDQISELFDIAREVSLRRRWTRTHNFCLNPLFFDLPDSAALQMLECCCHSSPIEIDADLCLHLANSSFAAVSGRGCFILHLKYSCIHVLSNRFAFSFLSKGSYVDKSRPFRGSISHF